MTPAALTVLALCAAGCEIHVIHHKAWLPLLWHEVRIRQKVLNYLVDRGYIRQWRDWGPHGSAWRISAEGLAVVTQRAEGRKR